VSRRETACVAGNPDGRCRGTTTGRREEPIGIGTSLPTTAAQSQPDQIPAPRQPTHPYQATHERQLNHCSHSIRHTSIRAPQPTPLRHQSICLHPEDPDTRPPVEDLYAPYQRVSVLPDMDTRSRTRPMIKPQLKSCRQDACMLQPYTPVIGFVGQSRRRAIVRSETLYHEPPECGMRLTVGCLVRRRAWPGSTQQAAAHPHGCGDDRTVCECLSAARMRGSDAGPWLP
jgi:hypothetical protein